MRSRVDFPEPRIPALALGHRMGRSINHLIGYFAGMLRKFEKDPATLCLGRTLWKLKDQAWGNDKRRKKRRP
jgi:hypothetical protein